MTDPIVLDNTKRNTFCTCKKKYYFTAVKGLQSNLGKTALRYGVAWHGAMEGYYSWVKENGFPQNQTDHLAAITAGLNLAKEKWDKETGKKTFYDDYRNMNTLVNAFATYLDYFKDDRQFMKVISTEKKFECPIEPTTEEEDKLLAGLPPIVFTGRIDLCVELDSQKWIKDFKTTGWVLDQVIAKSNRSPQLLGYSYAGKKVLDFIPNGCLASFAYVGAYKSKKTGEYGESKFDYRRVPQIYTQGDVRAWKLSFIDTCREIIYATENDLFPESFDNCYQYGACPYLRLCQQHVPYDDLNLEGYHVEFWDVLAEDEV